MPNQPKTPMRSLRVPDELWNATRELAQVEGVSVSEVVRAALEAHLAAKGHPTK